MITDQQAKFLRILVEEDKMSVKTAAAKAGMSPPSARKYLRSGELPSARDYRRTHRTRTDAFAQVWDEVVGYLQTNSGLEMKALFTHLQRKYPSQFTSGQLRTLQRRVKVWRAQEGPPKEVYFDQVYEPGDRAQSDFTCMNRLGVTIQGVFFPHILYHFVLTYSNWESGMICRSESFEALSAGLQKALSQLGGVPRLHQTDSMSCAVRNHRGDERGSFTQHYEALARHYGMEIRHTQPRSPHENGKIEQRHHRFKRALENQLTLRGSRDFASRKDYAAFLDTLFQQLNASRQARFKEEQAHLRALASRPLTFHRRTTVRVSNGSTIRVQKNRYSVPSRLIGVQVEVRVYGEWIEVWYAQKQMVRMPRLHGEDQVRIDYRHIVHTLVRKPGAFADYRYRAELFPNSTFRRAYDALRRTHTAPIRADRCYLAILYLAATQSESGVTHALERLLNDKKPLTTAQVQAWLSAPTPASSVVDVDVYDQLLDQPAAVGGVQ